MAAEAGPSGRVSAVEINPRFLKEGEGFEIIPGDILTLPLEENRFDVIHARYVLVHLSGHRPLLEKLRRALKPGGWMVLEEPDFMTAKPVDGTDREKDAVRRVNRAIEAMYAAKGIDPSFGTTLPAMMSGLGMTEMFVEMDTPLVPGGAGVAEVMAQSAEQLAARFQATGEASAEDIGLYAAYCRNPERWAVYYATVGVCFRKPE
jgi:SAM-dependent methyltransferase